MPLLPLPPSPPLHPLHDQTLPHHLPALRPFHFSHLPPRPSPLRPPHPRRFLPRPPRIPPQITNLLRPCHQASQTPYALLPPPPSPLQALPSRPRPRPPPNFRPRLCNEFPQRFRTVETSYGRALELVSWDPELAVPFPAAPATPTDRIIDRPAKFKQLRLRKGVNLKRRHRDYLVKFGELPDVNPYVVDEMGPPAPHTMEAERRACAVVREVLSLTVEKRTLVDHLTHFRKEFGLPNRLWGMLVRHPDMFYVSIKGQRDSVFLMEAYNSDGKLLLGEDDLLVAKRRLMELVSEGKKMRRWKRNHVEGVDDVIEDDEEEEGEGEDCDDDDDDHSLEELFDAGIEDGWEDFDIDDEEHVEDAVDLDGGREFWSLYGLRKGDAGCSSGGLESW